MLISVQKKDLILYKKIYVLFKFGIGKIARL